MFTLDDFEDDQKQYVTQLAKLTPRTRSVVNTVDTSHKGISFESKSNTSMVDPIVAKEFVETAKVIRNKQN